MGRSIYVILFFLTLLHLYPNAVSKTQVRSSKFLRCGSHYLSSGQYWIASPRCIKKAYNCQYSIKVSPKNIISITCPHFSSSSRWCGKNHLQIQGRKYCGLQEPEDVSRRGQLKIVAFSRGHPEKIKYLCQILVSVGQTAVSTSIPVASTSVLTATTALTQAPTTAASKSTVSAAVPPTPPTTVPKTTAAPTTIVPETSTLETTVSSTAAPSLTTVPETTAAHTTIVPETSTLETTVSSAATPIPTRVPDTTTVSTTKSPCEPQPPVQCGRANRRQVRIAGGEETERNEFPWLAAVVRTGESAPTCSATILNSLYLITFRNARCSHRDMSRYEILFHKHITFVDQQQMEAKIESKIPHPNVPIDLLKLRAPIEFPSDNSVAPICLPPEDRTDYAGAEAIVAGWGRTLPSDPRSRPEALMKLSVTVQSAEDCKYGYPRTAQYMCTEPVDGKGACHYDEGAPLILAGTDDTYSIIGVADIVGCGNPYAKDMYVRITPLLPWIREHIADGNFCANQ